MDSSKLRNLLVEAFMTTMTASPSGLKLRGELDAAQHELLTHVVRDFANNVSMVLAPGGGVCGVCTADIGEPGFGCRMCGASPA